MNITFVDLFAGVGGFRRGMELSGHKCVGFCEFDKFAAASYTSMHLITDAQREYLSALPLKQRQKEILKSEYRNGEWYANDIRGVDARSMPKADCWCFGAPCQDFSVAGNRAGLNGDRSSLIREVFRILEEFKEEDRPRWIIYENVKGMLSSNRGLDYLSIISELDRLGYDIEWQNINSCWFVPQNRERIYTIGHLRRKGTGKILPIERTDGESCISVIGHRAKFKRSFQTYSGEGIVGALDTAQGGGSGPHIAILCNTNPSGKGMNGNVFNSAGLSPSLTTNKGEGIKIALPVIKVKEATKQGYAVAKEGDSVNLSVIGSKTRRGRVGKNMANTLDTSCNQGVVNSDLVNQTLCNRMNHIYRYAVSRLLVQLAVRVDKCGFFEIIIGPALQTETFFRCQPTYN